MLYETKREKKTGWVSVLAVAVAPSPSPMQSPNKWNHLCCFSCCCKIAQCTFNYSLVDGCCYSYLYFFFCSLASCCLFDSFDCCSFFGRCLSREFFSQQFWSLLWADFHPPLVFTIWILYFSHPFQLTHTQTTIAHYALCFHYTLHCAFVNTVNLFELACFWNFSVAGRAATLKRKKKIQGEKAERESECVFEMIEVWRMQRNNKMCST